MEELIKGEVRELDQHSHNGITKTLWWVSNTLDTFVTVEDVKGHNFTVDVPSPEKASHVFKHVMAYTDQPSERRTLYASTEQDQ